MADDAKNVKYLLIRYLLGDPILIWLIMLEINWSRIVKYFCAKHRAPSNDLYRWPTEIVQNFSSRGSSHRRKSAMSHTV